MRSLVITIYSVCLASDRLVSFVRSKVVANETKGGEEKMKSQRKGRVFFAFVLCNVNDS